MKILITGAQGQLGTELRHLLELRGMTYRATDAKDLDITDEAAVNVYLLDYVPEVVYVWLLYTAVDKAEDEAKAMYVLVNVDGTRNLAKALEKVELTLVYMCTDYVFDGDSKEIYTVNDVPLPRNEYGRAKYEGEQQG